MKPIHRRRRFFPDLVRAVSLSFLLSGPVVFAGGKTDAGASVEVCPPALQGLSVSFQTKYTPPRGWGHADSKGIKSKGGAYKNLSPVVIGHAVKSRNLTCSYGYGADDQKIVIATIKQTMPKGVSCTAVAEYSFRCVAVGK